MKIAISVDSKNKEDQISDVFGRSKFFAIYDRDADQLEFIDNPGHGEARGAGIAAAQCLVNQKVNKVYLTNIGPNAQNVLDQAGIKIKAVSIQPLKELLK